MCLSGKLLDLYIQYVELTKRLREILLGSHLTCTQFKKRNGMIIKTPLEGVMDPCLCCQAKQSLGAPMDVFMS